MDQTDARPASGLMMMSRTAVKHVSMEIIVASIFWAISLSVTLALGSTWVAEGLAEHADDPGAFAYRQKQTNKYLLGYNLNLEREGPECKTQGQQKRSMFQNWVGTVSFFTLKLIPGQHLWSNNSFFTLCIWLIYKYINVRAVDQKTSALKEPLTPHFLFISKWLLFKHFFLFF